MTSHDYADDIVKIEDFKSFRYFEPQPNWGNKYIKSRSSEIWAIDDILTNCYANPTVDPREIIKGFIDRMELYIDICANKSDKCFSFSYAKEAAMNVLNYLN